MPIGIDSHNNHNTNPNPNPNPNPWQVMLPHATLTLHTCSVTQALTYPRTHLQSLTFCLVRPLLAAVVSSRICLRIESQRVREMHACVLL